VGCQNAVLPGSNDALSLDLLEKYRALATVEHEWIQAEVATTSELWSDMDCSHERWPRTKSFSQRNTLIARGEEITAEQYLAEVDRTRAVLEERAAMSRLRRGPSARRSRPRSRRRGGS
jgi:hypothetical protein